MLRTELRPDSVCRLFVAVSLVALGAASASAQSIDPTPTAPATQPAAPVPNATENIAVEDPADTIVVTGSRIARPNTDTPVPIVAINAQQLTETGKVSIGDVLNDLPSLRSTYSQANSTRFLGTAGLNLLDLRGLGTQRTLVLLDGRRHVASDILNNAVSPDINIFPTDLIERVEIITGGSSAVYGSDAIAGVVNFILKRNFEGVELRGLGGISGYGDAGTYRISGTAGTNFADGRGNVAVNLEYTRQQDYFGSERPNLRQNDGFLTVDTDPAGTPNGSDGNPDRTFFQDIRSATLGNTGLVRFNTGTCGTDPEGTPYNCVFRFNPDGTLAPQTGQRVGIGPNGSFIGGNGDNFRNGDELQLAPTLDRFNATVIGRFEVSEAFEPFVEAKYSRTRSVGTGNSGPAFITGTALGDSRERPRLDNPYLGAQARDLITQQLTLQNGTAPAPTARFSLRQNLLGLGARTEEATRETWRGVIGARGTFNDDWRYEASINYGEFKERTKILGNLNIQRFLLAADAARDPASGNIVCRSRFDPDAAIPYVDNDAILANDIAACVPINLFGGGNISPEARNYVLTDTTAVGKISQFVASAFLAGDSSDWFELPGGPVGFVIGGEHRRETARYQQDELVEQGYTFYNIIPTFSPPSFQVTEGYAEIRLPILADRPFFHNLTVTGAGRIARYKGSTGTVYAYNGGIEWAPVRDLRFRANYARAVRAPNLVELFTPPGQNFATVVDPCSAGQIGTGTATREANCRAAGVPQGFNFIYSSSLEIVSGGNPDLKAETSDSWTIGGVLQPRFAPGFTLTVDYYDVTVNKVITSPSAQNILNACYDGPDLTNQFCSLFQRSGAGGGPNGEEPFQIVEGSLQQIQLNYAKLKVRGIDVEAAYRHEFQSGVQLGTRVLYTRAIQNDQFLDPANPNFADQLLLELGDPRDSFNWNVDLKAGPFSLAYQMRYIGKMIVTQGTLGTYEDFFGKQGRPPQNADFADRTFYSPVTYHNVRAGVDVNDKFNFYIGVDNIGNRKPPLGLTGIGGGSAIYDNRGRFFYAGAVAKF
ncbi:TonB-dependent receptor domain-containing protein [Sandaracinobacteroides saxicola]|uniref:TonB-dependent receptor n=1 Tax=Sandaracinobacteroides saxicola TaxID=2759707 RepID=A0A7G5IGC5_9SPHN|nr:TonB-dependent receptor [Sandaracinobacteroides saxicola]QMW22417.1 TonB-dependent receptor [Sandaracinobacteroides saxicola]